MEEQQEKGEKEKEADEEDEKKAINNDNNIGRAREIRHRLLRALLDDAAKSIAWGTQNVLIGFES